MDTNDLGRSAAPSGYSAEPEPISVVSAVPVSIPNAPERFRLIQDGQPVASAQGPSAFAEISHYAHVYGQDGPVRVEYHNGKQWKPLYSVTGSAASAIEARRAATTGAVHESAIGNAETPNPEAGHG